MSLQSWTAARKLDWNDALRQGERLLKAGCAAESLAYFRRSLKDNPGEYGTARSLDAAREGLAVALDRLGRHREAARVRRGAADLGPGWRALHVGLLFAAILSPMLIFLIDVPKVLRWLPNREEPPTLVSLSRGETRTVQVEFDECFDVSALDVAVETATPENRVGAWEGFEKVGNEVRLPGRVTGLRYFIDAPRFAGKCGAATLRLEAAAATPPGTYRVWLSGVYVSHVRKKGAGDTRTPNDPILTMAGDPLEPNVTVPWDDGQRIRVVEVTVR